MVFHTHCSASLQHCCNPGYASKMKMLPGQQIAFGSDVRFYRKCTSVCASQNGSVEKKTQSRPDALRKLLLQPGIIKGPCCHDGLSAKLIEQAGFSLAFMSGFGVAASRLGAPDTNLLSYQEVLDQGRNILEATQALPVIGDGDTGFGNALSVKRTVHGFANAGFAGILIEDQTFTKAGSVKRTVYSFANAGFATIFNELQAAPKSCGHVRGKKVVSRGEAVARIRAAVDARDESGSNIVIVARSDAYQAESFDEALWRAAAFADAGADILFIDALESREEMRAFCSAGGGSSSLPKMANMLEGGGKTPLVAPVELEQMGFKLVAYPLSLLGVSMRAMQSALQLLKAGQLPPANMMPSFQDIQETVGFPEYFEQAERYAVNANPPSTSGDRSSSSFPSSRSSQKPVQSATVKPAPSEGASASPQKPTSAGIREIQLDFIDPEPSQEARRRDVSDSSGLQAAAEEGQKVLERKKDSPEAMAQGKLTSLDEELRGMDASSDGSGREDNAAAETTPVVEADTIVVSGTGREPKGRGEDPSTALRRARFLRVKITETATGSVRLETRLPSQFVDGMAMVIPQVAGVDLEELVREIKGEWTKDQPIADFQAGSERVQIYLDGLA